MTSTLEQNMRSTTEKFLYSWNGDWIHSAEPNIAQRSPDCIHRIYPKAMNVPDRDNEAWLAYFKNISPHIKDGTMIIDDYIAIPNQRKVVVRSSFQGKSPVGVFANEYVWWLTFDADGAKIGQIEEFMDSKAATDLLTALRENALPVTVVSTT